ncbi:MAG TPA: AAA family ATPase, partial [Leifsonia sp.]
MTAVAPPPGGLARVCPEFVGREDLLALALRRWRESSAGAGHVLLLGGEAGVGKSRLLDEFTDAAHPARIVRAESFAGDRETPGLLMLGISDGIDAIGQPQAADRLRDLVLDAGATAPSDSGRRLLVARLASALGPVLADPLLLRIEDLHWADQLSLDALERVAGSIRSSRSMIVSTYRSDELLPADFLAWKTGLLGRRHAEDAHLGRLDAGGTARMFASILGRPPTADELDHLFAASDGIPLHVEELVADGMDRVPDTVADAVVTRMQELTPPAHRILGAAAVLGRSFDVAMVALVAAEDPVGVEAALDELIAHHFVVPREDGPGYDFRHALIRDAVITTLSRTERRELHGRAAAAASEAGLPDAVVSAHYESAGRAGEAYALSVRAAERASALSAHREAAELFQRAERTMPSAIASSERASLHRRLGEELTAIDATERAEAELSRAVELLRAGDDELGAAAVVPSLIAVRHLLGAPLSERAATIDDALHRIEVSSASAEDPAEARLLGARVTGRLLAARSAANMLDRRLDDARDDGRRALELLPESEVDDRLGVSATLGSVMVFAGAGESGWDLLASTAADAARQGREAQAARAFRMLGSSASVLLEYTRAAEWLTEGIAYARRTERWNDAHYLVAHLAHVRWATGHPAEAELLASEALAEGGSAVTTRVTALLVLGYSALVRGRFEEAARRLEEARGIGERMRELQRLSPALWGLAEAALRTGRTAEAIEITEQGFAASAAVTDAAYLFPFVVTGTRARLAVKDTAAAEDWATRCELLLTSRALPGTEAAAL